MAEDKKTIIPEDERSDGPENTGTQTHINPEDEAPVFVPQGNDVEQNEKKPGFFARVGEFFKLLFSIPIAALVNLANSIAFGREEAQRMKEEAKASQEERDERESLEKDMPVLNEKIKRILEQQMKSEAYQSEPMAIKTMELVPAPENHPEWIYGVKLTLVNGTHYQPDAVFKLYFKADGKIALDDMVPSGVILQAEALYNAVRPKDRTKDVADDFHDEMGGDNPVVDNPQPENREGTNDVAVDTNGVTFTTQSIIKENQEEMDTAVAYDANGKELMTATLQFNAESKQWDISVQYVDKHGVTHQCIGTMANDGTIQMTYPANSTVFENATILPLLTQTVCNVCKPTLELFDKLNAQNGLPEGTPAARYSSAITDTITQIGTNAFSHLSGSKADAPHTLHIIPNEDRLGATVLSVRPQAGVVHLYEQTIPAFGDANRHSVTFVEGSQREAKLVRNGADANALNADMAVRACIMMHESFAQNNVVAVYPGANEYMQHLHIPGESPAAVTVRKQYEGVTMRTETALTRAQMDVLTATMQECGYTGGFVSMARVGDKAIDKAVESINASVDKNFSTYAVLDSTFISCKNGQLHFYSAHDHAFESIELSTLKTEKGKISAESLREALTAFTKEHAPHEVEHQNESHDGHTVHENDTHDEADLSD